MKVKKGLVLIVVGFLVLSLVLCAGAADSGVRLKVGAMSHRDSLFFGDKGSVVGIDYLFRLGESPFGIAGGLEYIHFAKRTFYSDTDWKDIATTLSFLYFPTLMKEVYLAMGLEYHWLTEQETYFYRIWHTIRRKSGLGLHLIVGFNLGKRIFLEGKISSVGIGYKNKGGISLQIGGRF